MDAERSYVVSPGLGVLLADLGISPANVLRRGTSRSARLARSVIDLARSDTDRGRRPS